MVEQQESKKAGNMEDISDMGAVIQSLKSELNEAAIWKKDAEVALKDAEEALIEAGKAIAQLEKEKEALIKSIEQLNAQLNNEKDELKKQLQSYKEEKVQLQINLSWLFNHKGCPPMTIEQSELIDQLLKDAE